MKQNKDTFCKIIDGELPATIIENGDGFLAILDIEPRTEGHTLIIPKQHASNLHDISVGTLKNLLSYAQKREKELFAMGYTGICTRINSGTSQDISHLHIHMWGEDVKLN